MTVRGMALAGNTTYAKLTEENACTPVRSTEKLKPRFAVGALVKSLLEEWARYLASPGAIRAARQLSERYYA
jgi:hypothetical protein